MKTKVKSVVGIMLLLTVAVWARGETDTASTGERTHVTAYWSDGVPPPKGRTLEYVNERFNMDLEIVQVPIDQYTQKLTLAMASGELADLIQVRNPIEDGARVVRQLIDSDLVVPLDPYLDKYPNLKKYLSDPEAKRFSMWDGKHYTVPKRYFYHTTAFYYRKDLLDKYGMKIPTTIDEFHDVMKVVAQGEGIPGYTSRGIYFGNHYFFTAYTDVGYGHPAWKWKDGRYTDMSISEEWKKSLRLLNTYYKERILDPEFMLIIDFAKWREKFTTGKVVSFPVHCEANFFYDEMVGLTEKTIAGADVFGGFPPVGPDGPHNARTGSPYGTVDMLVAKSAKSPEKILAMWNFLFSEEGDLFNFYGIEGVHWKKEGGKIVVNQEEVAKDTGSPSDPISKFRWLSNIMPDWIPDYSIDPDRQRELIAWGQKHGVSPYVVGFASPTLLRVQPDLSKLRDQYFIKFITGELGIDQKWDEYVKAYRDAGYDILEKEVNEYANTPDGKMKSRR